jgi:uroporphyrinogen-III synthase
LWFYSGVSSLIKRKNILKIKSILVSQPEPPATAKSPYFELAEKHGLKIDFRPFIQVESISAREFRQTRIKILDHTAVVFTSRTAIDHFFKICDELRLPVPDSMKYFCISEATAYYLQKYIVYRKRKISYGNGKFTDLINVMKKHKEEKFLVPLSDIHKQEIPDLLDEDGFNYTKAILYKTVSSDLSDLKNVNYDVLVFFSPSGIKSLFQNFPDFKQNEIVIACFGPTTAQAVKEAGLKLNIEAPTAQAPSMTMALEQYIKKVNKNG